MYILRLQINKHLSQFGVVTKYNLNADLSNLHENVDKFINCLSHIENDDSCLFLFDNTDEMLNNQPDWINFDYLKD